MTTFQPLARDADYFTVMGLPRKLDLDPAALEPVYHALSRQFHPDMYRTATPRERMLALESSALVNQAYRTLRDPFERAAYLLDLELGRDVAKGKDSPPQDLFEEILEVQELLGEFKFADDDEKEPIRSRLAERRTEVRTEEQRRAAHLTGELFRRWDALDGDSAAREAVLDEMRRILGERGYLRRVLNTLDEALA